MKKLSIILIALIAFAQTAWAQFASGSGTQYDPYIINNETHWNNFCYALQQNSTWSQFSGKYYKLGADIGTSSNPVNTMAGSVGQEFCGTFDGNGKTIHNNCYYLNPLGTTQGKVAYTRTETPANIGTPGTNHGIVQAYTYGLKFNNKYYVGSDSDLTVNSAGTEYTINTATGWNYFCAILAENDKGFFTGKTVKLGNNITVSTMAGSSYHDLTGTFDGQGHTLTFNCGTSSQPLTEQYCAPFRYGLAAAPCCSSALAQPTP